MPYAVYTLNVFDEEMSKFSRNIQEQIEKVFLQLSENPYVGDQVQYPFLREKRIQEKRIFWLIYDDLKAVLMVAISGKKTQQVTINNIVRFLPEYRKQVIKLINEND